MIPVNSRALFTRSYNSGAQSEGRQFALGGSFMPIGAFVKSLELHSFGEYKVYEHGYPIPLTHKTYYADLRLAVPLSSLGSYEIDPNTQAFSGDFGRCETISFWQLSYQEILRHLVMASEWKRTSYWRELETLAEKFKESIIQAFNEYTQMILQVGDFSFDQFKFYVSHHERSRSPYEDADGRPISWADIAKSEPLLRRAWREANAFIVDFSKRFLELCGLFVPGSLTYRALRARQADYTAVKVEGDRLILKCDKWRDRKAGGIPGLSQLEYPIYKRHDLKMLVYAPIFRVMQEISPVKLHDATFEGVQFFKDLIDNGIDKYYDLKSGEKQVGILLKFLPFMVNLGESTFTSEIALEMYSGIGPTRPLNGIVLCLHLRNLSNLGFDITGPAYIGGDNLALANEITLNGEVVDIVGLDKSDRILGIRTDLRRAWPLSLVTDSAKHTKGLPGRFPKIVQTLKSQPLLRVVQSTVSNNLLQTDSYYRLLEFSLANKLELDTQNNDEIFELINEDENLQEDFLSEFGAEADWCNNNLFSVANVQEPQIIYNFR